MANIFTPAKSRFNFQAILSVLAVAMVLMGCALYNRFPLVNSDSGAYIANGFKGAIAPFDRPVFYSWFVRHSSMAHSLWFAIFAQCIILAWCIIRVSALFLTAPGFRMKLAIGLLVMSFSCVGWYSGQLMADIFTAILALSLISYLLQPKRSWIELPIIFFAALVHNSNLISLSCACMLLVALRGLKQLNLQWPRLLACCGISALAWLTTMSYHAALGYGFRASRGAPVFLIGKMCENGILPQYLEEYCPTEPYKLCEYRAELPDAAWKFVWSDSGPVAKLGGLEGNGAEYESIIRGTLSHPKYLGLNLLKAGEATTVQLAQLDGGLLFLPYREGSAPFMIIQDYFRNEFPAYLNSRQNADELKPWDLDRMYQSFLILSSITAIFLLRPDEKNRHIRQAYLILLLFILCNAFATSVFANVLSRLQSRLIWTLSMFNILLLLRWAIERGRLLAAAAGRAYRRDASA